MRIIATVLLSLLALQFIQAEDISKKLPEKVTTYMKDNYPAAKKVEWMKTRNHNYNTNVYQAHFYNNGLLITLEITPEGLVLAKETELLVKDVPKDLLFYIQGHTIKFAAIIEYHDDKPVYLLETRFKRRSDFKVFNSNGTVVHIKKHFLLL